MVSIRHGGISYTGNVNNCYVGLDSNITNCWNATGVVAYFGGTNTYVSKSYSLATISVGGGGSSTPIYQGRNDCFSFYVYNVTGGSYNDVPIKVTLDDLKNSATFVRENDQWDFENIWEFDPSSGLPRLQWEKNIKN